MIERTIKPRLLRLAKQYPVVTMTGPRQSGKTTLCQAAFPRKPYISLENLDTRRIAIKDPRQFLLDFPDGLGGAITKEAQARFGFLLGAFKFAAPPHGGMALGIDRVVTILLGLESIREVIAFPKNQKAVDPMTEAPSPVGEKQLKELGIKLR